MSDAQQAAAAAHATAYTLDAAARRMHASAMLLPSGHTIAGDWPAHIAAQAERAAAAGVPRAALAELLGHLHRHAAAHPHHDLRWVAARFSAHATRAALAATAPPAAPPCVRR